MFCFIRTRKLTFPIVVLLIMNSLQGSLMDELDQFFQVFHHWKIPKRAVTPSAFSQARRKLSHKVFIDLLDVICRFLNCEESLSTFKGFRVFAVDGSTMRVPNTPEVRKRFGVSRNNVSDLAMARVSILFDVLNRVTYDAILGHFNEGEIGMAWQHLEEAPLPDNSLILFDRGYYDFVTLRHLYNKGFHACIRLRSNLGIYKHFMKTGLDDAILTLHPPKRNMKGIPKESNLNQSFTVRVVRFKIKKQTYILMTTLLDQTKVSIGDLGNLYHARWQVEESYKVKKCRLHIEHISGKTSEIALQDFHARIFKEALTACLCLEVQKRIEFETLDRKLSYKPCLTQALAKMKGIIGRLCLLKNPTRLIHGLLDLISKSLVAIEANRCYPRNGPKKYGAKTQSQSFGYRLGR